MISICSLPSSLTIALTLAPLIPTHAPTGSTLGTFALTAILVLDPASLAIPMISTTPSLISVTSSSKSFLTSSCDFLETLTTGPPFSLLITSTTYNLILSPGTNFLSLNLSSALRTVWILPRSIVRSPLSATLCIIPVISSFSLE